MSVDGCLGRAPGCKMNFMSPPRIGGEVGILYGADRRNRNGLLGGGGGDEARSGEVEYIRLLHGPAIA